MMKYCLAALAVLALAGVPALAQVDNNYLDGTINAWAQHGMLQTANVAYYGAWPTPPPPVVNIVSYGMTVQGGTVYGMIQLDNPISTVSGTTTVNSNGYLQSGDNNWKGAIWAGWYINADNNTSTSLAGEPIGWGMPGPGPNGTDIEPEWDISDQPYAPYGFNLWARAEALGTASIATLTIPPWVPRIMRRITRCRQPVPYSSSPCPFRLCRRRSPPAARVLWRVIPARGRSI